MNRNMDAATRLHSQLVRRRSGRCEYCASTSRLHAAHIVVRSYAALRCDSDNVACLCAACHEWFGRHAADFEAWVDRSRGKGHVDGLRARALPTKVDWGDVRAAVERECYDYDPEWAADVIRARSLEVFARD